MTPDFALETDRIFAHTLRLLDRIENKETVDYEREQEGLRGLFAQAESRLGSKPGWDLAKYGLVAWIDERLITAAWEGRDWWANNSLEFSFFRTRTAAKAFFDKAKEAKGLNRRDAAEIFYLCAVLGFRGIYHTGDYSLIGDAKLPKDIDAWARTMAVLPHELSHQRPALTDRPREASGAPPRNGKFQFVGVLLLFIFLSTTCCILGYYVYHLSRSSAVSATAYLSRSHATSTP